MACDACALTKDRAATRLEGCTEAWARQRTYSPFWLDCCRGTDSHSIYNWAENMRYWSTDFDVPFPGSDGAKVHTGMCIIFTAVQSSFWAGDLPWKWCSMYRAIGRSLPGSDSSFGCSGVPSDEEGYHSALS